MHDAIDLNEARIAEAQSNREALVDRGGGLDLTAASAELCMVDVVVGLVPEPLASWGYSTMTIRGERLLRSVAGGGATATMAVAYILLDDRDEGEALWTLISGERS